jgi:hypothetical protein
LGHGLVQTPEPHEGTDDENRIAGAAASLIAAHTERELPMP